MTQSRSILRPRWKPTDAQLDQMRREFPTRRTAELAAEFGVTYHQVARLARTLGLRKDEAWLNGSGGRLDGVKGTSTRFQKGLVPWTKGRKGIRLSPATEWKPGQVPFNRMPIGSFRVAACGYLQIKVHETGYPPRDWVMFHRHVWERAHGPIPPGHVIAFRDGRRRTDPSEVTLDVLQCLTRAEHMLRHTFHQYGPEIAGLVQLRGAITRQINRRERAKDEA